MMGPRGPAKKTRPNRGVAASWPSVKVCSIRTAAIASLMIAAPSCYQGVRGGHDGTAAADGDGGSADSAGSEGGDDAGPDTGPTACAPAVLDMRRLTELQYRRSIDAIFDGRVAPSGQFPAPSGKTPTGFSTELGAVEVGEHDVEQLVYAAEDVAEGVAAVLDELLPCAQEPGADLECAGAFLDRYGRRAWRRTLTDDERALLLASFSAAIADDASFTDAVALMVDGLLQAPQFVYIVEDAAAVARPLTGIELASRLSFLLWDAGPDDALLDLAESGALDDPATVTAQAQRLLASPQADTTIARAFREWMQVRTLSSADKSSATFPEFDATLAASMNAGFDHLAVATVREGGTLDDLLRTTQAWVDPTLAGLLGVDAPADGEWAAVELDATRYRGLLTHPALLASLAHSDRTSPVFRGAFVRRRLLCEALPPPPPNAVSTQLDLPPDPTARQESEARLARGDCAGCHGLIDPAGLALERFDALGRYRETDELGRAIDPAGALPGVGEDELVFADHVELIDALAADPAVTQCFARQLFRFSLSRMETDADACTVATIEDALAQADGELETALLAILGADTYLQREAP